MLTLVSSNIVSRCILSHKSEEEDGCSKFGELVRRLLILFTGFCVGDMFHYLRWVDVLTGYIPSMKAVSAELDAFLNQVITEHRALEHRAQVTHKKDFVSIIMQLQKDGMFEKLTQDNIKAILLLPAGETAEKLDMSELYGLRVSKKTPLHALAIPHSSF
ncbi:hypothetical protein V6N13_016917 [Hibiscus sabdariffa]